jgi:hypothetical protein
MAKDAIDFSRPYDELFSGGFEFVPGPYEVMKSGCVYFDFKKPGNDQLCFMMEIKPVDGEETQMKYWSVGGKLKDGTMLIEPVNPVKGEKGVWAGIRFTENDKHGKLYSRSDFAPFIEQCQKNEVDMDAVGNDFTAFTGNTYEFGLYNVKHTGKAKTPVEKAEGAADAAPAKESHDVIVIVGVPKKGKKSAPKKADKNDDADDKPVAKKSKKAKGPESHVLAYIEDVIKKEVKDDDSADWTQHKLNLSRHLSKELGLEADEVREAMAVWNDREDALPALLDTVGLKINKDKEIVEA